MPASKSSKWLARISERGWRWPELPVLLAVAGLAGMTWVFVELAEQVGSGGTHDFDNRVLAALRNPNDPTLPLGPLWLVDAARDVTALGSMSVLLLMVVIAAGYTALVGRWRAVVLIVAATVSGAILSGVLKSEYERPRPPNGSAVQRTHTTSFPSGHSFSAAVVFLTLGAMLARVVPTHRLRAYLIIVALLLTLLVGFSRVYLGVHYPTDVLAGWAAGSSWALLWWLIARYAWPHDSRPADKPATAP